MFIAYENSQRIIGGFTIMLNGRSLAGHIAFLLQAAEELRTLALRDASIQQTLIDFADAVEHEANELAEIAGLKGPGFV